VCCRSRLVELIALPIIGVGIGPRGQLILRFTNRGINQTIKFTTFFTLIVEPETQIRHGSRTQFAGKL
jgi:hypothetical protein